MSFWRPVGCSHRVNINCEAVRQVLCAHEGEQDSTNTDVRIERISRKVEDHIESCLNENRSVEPLLLLIEKYYIQHAKHA